jgi:hypothetical protein
MAHSLAGLKSRVFVLLLIFLLLPAGTVAAQQVLYVGNDNTPGGIQQYTLPITGSSTPNFTFAANNTTSVAVNASGSVAIGDFTGQLQFFAAPISGASTPSATFANGAGTNTGALLFNPGGDLFASTVGATVNRFTAPFTNASVPSQTITTAGLTASTGLAMDASQNLYVADSGAPGGSIFVFAPPYTASSVHTPAVATAAYRKIAISGSQLFVANVNPGNGSVDVYNLPLTNASAPAFSITTAVNTPEAVAFDAGGNLHVGNLAGTNVTVYSAPFSAASAPVTTMPDAGVSIFGIAIGPGSGSAPVPAFGITGLIALCAVLAAAGLMAMRMRS